VSTSPAAAPSSGLKNTTAGILAYITIIPAIYFLLSAPYNKNNFVRFHSFQCLLLTGVSICGYVLMFVPYIGFPVYALVEVAVFVAWIVCLVKANQGQSFKLPVIGDIAEQQAKTA